MGGRTALMRVTRLCLAALCALLSVAGCDGTSGRGHASSTVRTSSGSQSGSQSSPGATSSAPASSAPAPSCTTRAEPDPNRPQVTLSFSFSSDLTRVHGTERVVFTPDLPITELVFRLTANSPATVKEGNRVVVDSAVADHGGGSFTVSRGGAPAGTQGGLLHIPFGQKLAAGTTVRADITFDLTLGTQAFDRFAYADSAAGRFAWIGSGQPLLAWERGYGWHTEDLIQFIAESATSEAMDTDLTVVAPGKDTVIMSGDPSDPPPSSGARTWHARIAAARDVAVAVGPFAVTDTVVDGVRVRLGAYDPALRDSLVPEFRRAITELEKRFGPYPFPSLSVARVPSDGGGIEYPSAILMLSGTREVAVHETAHQWFYAMLGDAQSLHPWLDEAFASYAEQLVDDDAYDDSTRLKPGTVDRSAESYGLDSPDYYFVTYAKGSTALQAARRAAGPAAWDAALRCYVNENAWRIVNPSDFEKAIARFPKAVAILRQAGALH